MKKRIESLRIIESGVEELWGLSIVLLLGLCFRVFLGCKSVFPFCGIGRQPLVGHLLSLSALFFSFPYNYSSCVDCWFTHCIIFFSPVCSIKYLSSQRKQEKEKKKKEERTWLNLWSILKGYSRRLKRSAPQILNLSHDIV